MSVLGSLGNVAGAIFNFAFVPGGGRWHTPMTTDISKLSDFGDAQSEFGDEDGDHPLPAIESTLSDETFGTIETYPITYTEAKYVHTRW